MITTWQQISFMLLMSHLALAFSWLRLQHAGFLLCLCTRVYSVYLANCSIAMLLSSDQRDSGDCRLIAMRAGL